MHEFCVKLGWCGGVKDGKRLHVFHFIPETGPVSADQFTKWLIAAEGLDPDQLGPSERKQLTAVFVRHMSANVVDASNLRSEYPDA